MSQPNQNSNDAGISTRLAFIDQILADVLQFKPLVVRPIAYEEGFPFPYNNFVYAIEVDKTGSNFHSAQPGTDEIPGDMFRFILRIPNPQSGYNDQVRIENEVAALSLARNALQTDFPNLVPRVFAWESAKGGRGWMLQEHLDGKPILEDFPGMEPTEQSIVLHQMAKILHCFQRYELPSSVEAYGGLTFDSSGRIVSGPSSIMKGGPFNTYEELRRFTIMSKLETADRDPNVDGWRNNGIRARLDQFLSQGVNSILKARGDFFNRKVLVHADFSVDNILYDPQTKKLTGVFDFDFAHIGTAADDFFRSLGHGIGRFPDARDATDDELALQQAMLHGFPDKVPSSSESVQWGAAKVWDQALQSLDAIRPSTIPQILLISELFWLSSQILPFKLCNEVVVSNSTTEQIQQRKADGESRLDIFLKDNGF